MKKKNKMGMIKRFALVVALVVSVTLLSTIICAGLVEAANLIVYNNSAPTQTPYFVVNGTTGNTGLGVATPITKAHTYGTLTVDAAGQSLNSYSEGIRLGAASNGYSIVTFGSNAAAASGSQANMWWAGKHGGTNGFNIWGASAGDAFHILQTGLVGIGTTTPSRSLDVRGWGNFSGSVYLNNGTEVLAYINTNIIGNSSGANNASSTYVPYNGASRSVNLAANNLTTTTGRIGIGTATPATTLHVVGNTTFEGTVTTGGQNLMRNADLALGDLYWGGVGGYPEYVGTRKIINSSWTTPVRTRYAWNFTTTSTGPTGDYTFGNIIVNNLKVNSYYTASCYVKTTSTAQGRFGFMRYYENWTERSDEPDANWGYANNDTWFRVHGTFNTGDRPAVNIALRGFTTNGSWYVTGCQLEEGKQASTYQPSPIDAVFVNDGSMNPVQYGLTPKIVSTGFTATSGYSIYVPTQNGSFTNRYAFVSEANAGSVGIGNTAPLYKLQVDGNVSFNNSLYVHNNGFVGIGINNPSRALDVRGVGNFSGTIYINNGTDVAALVAGADDWNVSGTNLFPLSLLYNVGIGTTTPGSTTGMGGQTPKFAVTGYSNLDGLRIKGSDTSNTIYSEQGILAITTNGSPIYLGGGNVGIKTTTPKDAFSVVGNISKATTTGYDGAFDTFIKYGHKNDLEGSGQNLDRWIGIDASITAGAGSSNQMRFKVYNGTTTGSPVDIMTLRGDGSVGIGTTSPRVKFEVSGSSILASTTSINPDTYTSAVVAGGLSTAAGWTLTSAIGGNAGTGHSWGIGSNGQNLYFGYEDTISANTMQTYMQVLGRNVSLVPSSGNVGIGTTTPENLLHVRATDGVTGVIKIEGGNSTVSAVGEMNSRLDFGSNDASVGGTGNVGGRIASITEYNNGAHTGMAFYTYQQSRTPEELAEAMRINVNGYVGIGTTTPSRALDVRGVGNFSGTVYINNGTDIAALVAGSDDWNVSGSSLFPLSHAYNVSIGTSGSFYKLDVNGTGRFIQPTLSVDGSGVVADRTTTNYIANDYENDVSGIGSDAVGESITVSSDYAYFGRNSVKWDYAGSGSANIYNSASNSPTSTNFTVTMYVRYTDGSPVTGLSTYIYIGADSSSVTSVITPAGNGWYKVVGTRTVAVAGTLGLTGLTGFDTAKEPVYIDGWQAEVGPTPSPYVYGNRTLGDAVIGGNLQVLGGRNSIFGYGNVSIGSFNPKYRLEVNSADKALNISNFLFANSTQIGIGTTNPIVPLHLEGQNTSALIDDTTLDAGDREKALLVLKHTVSSSESGANQFDDSYPHAGISFKRDWTTTESTLAKVNAYGEGGWGGGLAIFTKEDDGSSSSNPLLTLDLTPDGNIRAPRGNITTTQYVIATNGVVGAATGATSGNIWSPSGQYPNWGINYAEGSPDYITFEANGNIYSQIALDTGAAHFGINGGAGSVGIGTTTPSRALDVRGVGNFSGTIYINNGTDISSIVSGSNGTSTYVPYVGANKNTNLNNWNLTNVQSIGIGTATSYSQLSLTGAHDMNQNSVRHYRDLAHYNIPSGSTVTGTMQIALPNNWTNTMMQIRIMGYDYSGIGAWEVLIGGYSYQPSPGWVNYHATITGRAPFNQVRLANNGTVNVILLGTTSTVWTYPKIEVTDFVEGHSTLGNWANGWIITNTTSEASIINSVVVPIDTYTDANGNFGIGTVTPSAKLQVSGGLNVTNGASFATSSGYVGIGTTGPAANLHVNTTPGQDANVRIEGSGAYLTMKALTDYYSAINFNSGTGAGTNRWAIGLSGDSANFRIYDTPNSVARLVVSTGGNVGIGTTAPATRLEVNGTIGIKDSTNSYYGTISTGYSYAPGEIYIRAGGSSNYTVFSPNGGVTIGTPISANSPPNGLVVGGNVGIGTTSPSTKLHVNGSITLSGEQSGLSNLFVDPSAAALAQIGANGDIISINSQFMIRSTSTLPISFYTGSTVGTESVTGTERMRITSTGEVGIGTTTPSRALDVRGIGNFSGTVYINNNTDLSAFVSGNGTGTYVPYVGANANVNLGVYNLTTGGRVGIVGSPTQSNLFVNGSIESLISTGGNSPIKHYQDLASFSGTNSPMHAITGELVIGMSKNWSEGMFHIKIQGYDYSSRGAWEVIVGGYSYAGSNTWINTNVEISGRPPFAQVRLASNGTRNVIILGNATTVWSYPQIVVSDLIVGYSGQNDWGVGWSIYNTTVESNLVNINTPTVYKYMDQSGNFGIGTAYPTQKLEVAGSINASSGSVYASTNIIAGSPVNTRVAITGSGGGNAISEYYSAESNPRWTIGRDLIGSGQSGLGFGDTSNTIAAGGSAIGIPTTRTLAFYTSTGSALAERARFDSSGNLGIGTNNPSQKLEVLGNIAISSSAGGSRYILINDTDTSGKTQLIMQAGAGSAGYGGGINLYGNAHATSGGSVRVGLSSSNATSMFAINNQGLGGGTDIFVVKKSGEVGIGNSTPTVALQIQDVGDDTNPILSIKGSPSSVYDPTLILEGEQSSANEGFLIRYDNDVGDVYINQTYTGITGTTPAIRFSTGNAPNAVVIAGAGNVGIGTTAPSRSLDVRGIGNFSGVLYLNNGTEVLNYINTNIVANSSGGNTNQTATYVPYVGANKNTVLGAYNLTTTGTVTGGTISSTGSILAQASTTITGTPWYNAGGAAAGYIKLVTPIIDIESNMFNIHVTGYQYGGTYSTMKSWDAWCSGYAYSGNPSGSGLISQGCRVEGTDMPVEITLENRTTSNWYVVLRFGTNTTSWYYNHFTYEYRGWNAKSPSGFSWVTGETNYSATSNYNNVVINDASGTVGIGTASPNQPLTVNGNANISGSLVLGSGSSGGGGSIYAGATDARFLTWNRGSNIYLGDVDNAGFASTIIRSGGADRITALTGGNIGINNSVPSSALHVNGTARLSFNNSLQFARDQGASEFSTFIGATNYPGGGYGGSDQNYWLHLSSKGGTHIVLNTDGGAGAAENVMDRFVMWQGAVGGDRLFEVGNTGNAYIRSGLNVSNNFVVTPAGNVGIGTTAPNYRLEVNNNAKGLNVSNYLFANSTFVGVGIASTTASSAKFQVYGGDAYLWGLNLGYGTSTANIDTDATSKEILFKLGGVERARLNTSGNFGINTTTPQAKLHVQGDAIINASATGGNVVIQL